MNTWRHVLPVAALLTAVAVFVVVERAPVQAQNQSRQLTATQWDYKVIVFGPIDNDKLEAQLKAAGAHGWECVSTTFASEKGTTKGVYVVLKKPM
jgi:hypothetical protein